MWQENESVLGLGIEEQGIKIVELRKAAEGIELVRAKILSLPPNSLKNGIIIEPKSIAAVIKDFLEDNNILTRKAVGVLDPSLTLVRLLRIPFMSENEMRSILETEANQYVDFKHKEKVIDFCLLEEINEEGIKKVNVAFAATLNETVNAFLKMAEEANLELIGIDVATLAIVRALYGVNIKSSSLEPVALVIINLQNIQLCILKGNRLRFLHTVEIEKNEFITLREEFINRLIFSIKLALNYYSRAIYGQEDIHNIIVNTNDLSLKDINKELSLRLEGLSVEKADTLGRLKLDKAVFSDEVKENISLSFAPVIGAVLRLEDTSDYSLSLNLIPLEKQQRLLVNKELALYASALTVLLATFVTLGSMLWVNNQLAQRKISLLSQQIKETTPVLNKLIREKSNNIDLDKRINEAAQAIAEINKNKSLFSTRLLAEVMLAVPEGLWLTDVSAQLKEENLFLKGNASDGKFVFEYVNSLINTGYFNKVEPVFSQTASQQEALPFLIKCQLKRL